MAEKVDSFLGATAGWTAAVRALESTRADALFNDPWAAALAGPAGAAWIAQRTPDAHHGRWTLPVLPTKIPGMPHNWFVTAVKA